jgi:tetratricopeptide (TPR) repeat protein
MRLHIIDPGLVSNRGHHANYCRYIADEARARGIGVRILAHRQIDAAIQRELDAVPLFRMYSYVDYDDPIAGWLTSFSLAKNVTRADLDRIPEIGADDIVFFHGAQPPQLMAAIEWASSIPAAQCPLIVVELGGEAGINVTTDPQGRFALEVPNPQDNPRPTLFRFCAQCMGTLQDRPFHVITYDGVVSATYSRLMERDIGVFPFPTPAIPKPRNRVGKRPIAIATLGHQQAMKGYHLLPEIAAALLKSRDDFVFLVHNSDPKLEFGLDTEGKVRAAQSALRELASRDSRLILDDREVDFQTWIQLVDNTDLMLCPYNPRRYLSGHSGVVTAAIASAIPLVVPDGTSLSHTLEKYGEPGVTFAKYDAASVLDALRHVLKSYDTYAERALAAADRWSSTQGPDNFLDQLLRLNQSRVTAVDTSSPVPANADVPGVASATKLKHRGDELLRAGDYDGAENLYAAALRENPNYGEVLANLALVFKAKGDRIRAEQHLRRASELLNQRPSVLANLGSLLHEDGRYEEACDILSRAESMMPESGWIKSNLGSALLSLNRIPEAVATLEAAVKALPNQSVPWFSLANARAAALDWNGAVAAYRRVLELDPANDAAQTRLRIALDALGQQL